MSTLRLGFLASHGGSNLQAIIDACADGTIDAEPVVVIGNNSGSKAMARGRAAGIETVHLSATTHPDPDALDRAILTTMQKHDVRLIALTGYMKRLGPRTVRFYEGRILNIHPALLPNYGGKGLYGNRVHQAVLAAGETESGATVHLVDEEYDHGATIAQARVPVLPGDTVETLSARVLEQEHLLYVQTIGRIAKGVSAGDDERATSEPGHS